MYLFVWQISSARGILIGIYVVSILVALKGMLQFSLFCTSAYLKTYTYRLN
jgi:hypothetical protein